MEEERGGSSAASEAGESPQTVPGEVAAVVVGGELAVLRRTMPVPCRPSALGT